MKSIKVVLLLLLCSTIAKGQFINNNGIALVNTANVNTNGDWTNSSGTSIINNGQITTSESFENYGILDPLSTGGFTLQFTSDKNFRPGGPTMSFLSKSGVGNVLLTGTISIKDSLMLKNGLIRLVNATDTVSIRAGALVVASPASYVEGLVARAGTGNLVFPLGSDGHYLPLTMNRVIARKLTASVESSPAAHTAGPGVDAMISFPYAWRVREQLDADTAAYVEVNYPSTLPVVANPIIARQIPGQQFASMGARFIANSAGRVTVRSYSRGTKGLFTVAQGFPTDFKTDSLALVALYNATGGPVATAGWSNKTGWTSLRVENWFGVTVTGQSITSVNLSNNQLKGNVPDAIVDILSLQNLNLSGNSLTSIPDFTDNTEIQNLNVSNNALTFASLEPNATVPGFAYQTQAKFGATKDESVEVGSNVTFQSDAGGQSSVYQWKRNGIAVAGANSPSYNVPAIGRTTMGEYVAEVTNPQLPGLMLVSNTQKVLAHADMNGKVYVSQTQPATKGSVVLYKVTNTKFDVLETKDIQSDGSYSFENKTLADYQIRGFADTLTYARALPTYFEGTIFWEEADTVFLETNVSNLNIYTDFEPLPPSGRGFITGTFEEDVPEGSGGRTKLPKPVRRAGVSARRVQNTGRGKEEVLTLVAYVFTDDEGKFTLPSLPTGTYRLNIQYPGYPMDESSDINLVIGEALQSQITVDARVLEGKIHVTKRIITGLFDAEKFNVRLFPNPAVDVINLYFDEEAKGRQLQLTALSGKPILSAMAEEKEARLNIGQIERGIYLLRVKQDGVSIKTLKVVIE
jgi:hypothetical protein